MKAIAAKKVSMLELFYDLIFVYAISKIAAMIHHPVAGSLPLVAFIEFVFVVIVVMQIWLYQVLYINRFGRSRLIDNIGLLISMYAAAYLANSINTHWSTTFYPFNQAVLLIVASLIWQYLCGSGAHPFRDRDVRAFTLSLCFEFIMVLIGVAIGYRRGIYFCVLGELTGFLMPLAIYHQFLPDKVNFPHLVERLSLIIIITFGETLVNVTRYFTKPLLQSLTLVIFILVATMFGSYILQSEHFINHHQRSRGFILMYSHVLMVVAILSLTAGLNYLADHEISRTTLWLLLTLSSAGYYLGLFINGVYNHRHLQLTGRDLFLITTVLMIGVAMAFLLRTNNLGLIGCFALAASAIWIVLMTKLRTV